MHWLIKLYKALKINAEPYAAIGQLIGNMYVDYTFHNNFVCRTDFIVCFPKFNNNSNDNVQTYSVYINEGFTKWRFK